jgi:hypothetical protein
MSNYQYHAGDWRLAGAATLSAGLLSLIYWYRRPISPTVLGEGMQAQHSLLHLYLPESEFAGEVSIDIHAPAHVIFDALFKVTLEDMPLAKWLGTLRYLPSIMAGKIAPVQTVVPKPFLEVIQSEGGNIILDEAPDSELVFGAIGQFHNLSDQHIVPIRTPKEFIEFDHPDYQKLAMSFRLVPLDDHAGYRLTLTHRTHALSRAARWKFALYWIGIKPGGNFVSWLMLRAIKSLAEKASVVDAFKNPDPISNRRFP